MNETDDLIEGTEETSCDKQSSVADFIEDLDMYYSRLPSVNTNNNSYYIDQCSPLTSQRSENDSYALTNFSLGDVDSFLREQDSNSIQTRSLNSNEEDDDIAEELMNLKDLEKNLAKELEILENTPTPERKRSLNLMNNSETWVSHTPETKPNEDNEEDYSSVTAEPYRPPSPPSAFEKFFLPFDNNTKSGDPSPLAVAARRFTNSTTTPTSRKLQGTPSFTSESILTEDFASAADNISLTSDLDDISLDDSVQKGTLFNDILGKQTILEETPEDDYEMANRRSKKSAPIAKKADPVVEETSTSPPPEEPVPAAAPAPTEETPKFDVIENVYEGAKTVWAFGKGIIVFKPFMGVAEGAATKVLSVTTGIASLEDADKKIKCTLSGVDKEFIDPAILKLWEVLAPIIGKGDEVVKTVLGVVTKNVPLLEEGTKAEAVPPPVEEMKKESPEAIAPETSTPAVIA